MNALLELQHAVGMNGMDRTTHDLMQQHFREEHLPEAVMPACPINKVLKEQKAIMTGANSGIGESVALALAHAGADVLMNHVTRPEVAEEVVRDATRCGANAFASQCEVRKEDQVQAMFQQAIQEFGTVDIMVNNAGLQKDPLIDQMKLADWQFILSVNLTGQVLCSREAIRESKRRGVRMEISCAAGDILCMSSGRARKHK